MQQLAQVHNFESKRRPQRFSRKPFSAPIISKLRKGKQRFRSANEVNQSSDNDDSTTANTTDIAKNQLAPAVDTDTTPASTQQSATLSESETQPEAAESTENYTRTPFDKEKILTELGNELSAIYALGNELRVEADGVQDKAIAGLAKILGVRRKFFDSATPEATVALMNGLYKECKDRGLKGKTARTTEFHFLSRIFRKSDRKQASADAKILIRAYNAGQTEETFAAWVKVHKGLNSILKGITGQERREKTVGQKQTQTKTRPNGNQKALLDAANEASWMRCTTFKAAELPEYLRCWIAKEAGTHVVLVQYHDDRVSFLLPQKDSRPSDYPLSKYILEPEESRGYPSAKSEMDIRDNSDGNQESNAS